jgi:hypothetical protein
MEGNGETIECDYEVPGMLLLQACLYTYSLLRGVTFQVLLSSSYVLSPMMLPLLEKFLELLLWNSFQCHHHIFWMSSVPRNLRTFKLFLETDKSHVEPNQGNRVGVPFQ